MLGAIPSAAQDLLLVGLGEPYGVPGIKPKLISCKTGTLLTIISLHPLSKEQFLGEIKQFIPKIIIIEY